MSYIHEVETKDCAALGVACNIDGGESPIQDNWRAENVLLPAAAEQSVAMRNRDFQKTNKSSNSGDAAD